MGRVWLLLVLILLARTGWAEEDRYTFRLNGKPADVEILSLAGTPERPARDDLAFVGRFSMVLGEPGVYDLSLTGKGDRLHRRREDGRIELLGLDLPPDAVPEIETATLRSVRLRKWGPGSHEFLSSIDLSQTCVMVHSWAGSFDRLPPLPEETRYLWIGGVKGGPGEWEALGRLKELRVLVAPRPSLLADRLSAAKHLRVLSAPAEEDIRLRWRARARVADPSSLAGLRELRHLDLKYADGLDDLSFLVAMPHLVRLEVSGTGVAALPAARLPALRVVRALAERGPRGRAQPEVDPASVSRFRAQNPLCRVTASWTELFRRALADVTRVRLRTGGNRETDPAAAKTLLDVSSATESQALLDGVRIDGGASGGHCYCDGDDTFEFYRGADLVAVVSLQHVHRLRWVDGAWPGDARLTDDSLLHIGHWCARHGAGGPLASANELFADRKARAARRQAQARAIGAALADRLDGTDGADDRIEAFRAAAPAASERALLWLRLFGAHEGSWGRSVGLEMSLSDEFDEGLPPIARAEALRRAVRTGDPVLLRGAARWLLGMKGHQRLATELLEEVLPLLARDALAHPRPLNRRVTLVALEKVGSEPAVALIRSHFLREIPPRSGPADLPDESPTRYAWFFRRSGSDRAQAALCLARLGRVEHREEIERMLAAATGDDRALLSAAVTWLRAR